jgi:t-SNARE complex subunit (syntaxin)
MPRQSIERNKRIRVIGIAIIGIIAIVAMFVRRVLLH